jgi:hypothetical protein
VTSSVNTKCIAGSLMIHLTSTASVYLENVWAWIADQFVLPTSYILITIFHFKFLNSKLFEIPSSQRLGDDGKTC